jgi:HK97 family phage prohead protease/HK97 family phage major capsid protein
MQIVHKTHTAEVGADYTYVLSTASVDSYGDVIEPAGWDLSACGRAPIALYNHGKGADGLPIGRWSDLRVERGRLIGKLNFARADTSPFHAAIVSLAEQGVLREVSVGFEPLEAEPLPGGRGVRYKRARLRECSLVNIPANNDAVQIAKSLNLSDDVMALVFGGSATKDHGIVRRHIGEHAATPPARKSPPMNNLSKRIEDAQNELVRVRDALAAQANEDRPDAEMVKVLDDELHDKEESLSTLRRLETALAIKSEPARDLVSVGPREMVAVPAGAPAIVTNRRPFNAPRKELSALDILVRSWVVGVQAAATHRDPKQVLDLRYPDDEATYSLVQRAAVAGATTTTAGWAAELVQTGNAEWLETLRPVSVFPSVLARGQTLNFGPNQGVIRVPYRASTPSIAGSFVGEGAPIPVRKIGLSSLSLSERKMAVISVMTREITQYSNPAIEGILRREIVADTAKTLDSLFLDAVVGDSVRPAGILNGVAGLTPTAGGGSNAILKDLGLLVAPFDTANAGRNIVLIMPPAQARALQWTPGPDNTFGWTSNVLGEMTVLSSTNVPAKRVIAIDCEDFVGSLAAPEFDLSGEAILHMEDTTPGQITTGAAAVSHPSVSMFQTAQIAIRMMMNTTWAMRRTGMVQFIDTVTW